MIECITQIRNTFDFNVEYANLCQSTRIEEAQFHYENITNNEHKLIPECVRLAKFIYKVKCRKFCKVE